MQYLEPATFTKDNGKFIGEHFFSAIDDRNVCIEGSHCHGWSMK